MSKGCYLLCFAETPLHHAKHYLGWSEDIEARIEAHRAGRGANLLAVLKRNGGTFRVVRTWPDADRAKETQLKHNKNRRGRGVAHLCPVCRQRRKEAQRADKATT